MPVREIEVLPPLARLCPTLVAGALGHRHNVLRTGDEIREGLSWSRLLPLLCDQPHFVTQDVLCSEAVRKLRNEGLGKLDHNFHAIFGAFMEVIYVKA